MTATRTALMDIVEEPLLMKQMIHALAIDGLVDGIDRLEAALACAGCTDRASCHQWLDVAALSGADHVPEFCANKGRFEALASEVPAGF